MNHFEKQGPKGFIHLFPTFSPTGGQAFLSRIEGGIEERFAKGEYIFSPGHQALCLYLLLEGRVKLGAHSEGGREIIKAILRPGDIFGEMAMLGVSKHRDYALAMDGGVRVRALTVAELKSVMVKNPEFSLRLSKVLGRRLAKTEQRLDALVTKDARTRVVDFLLELARNKVQNGEKGVKVNDFFTHRDIASLTATSRQTVTSILNDLREMGIISFDRKQLHIHNLETLQGQSKAAS